MGGPLGFLFGVGLVAAGTMRDAAKKEEMRKYNEEKKASPYLNESRQNNLELKVRSLVYGWYNAGGIDVRRLVYDIRDKGYNIFEAQNEAILLISKYLTETMSPYKYNRSNSIYELRSHGRNSENAFDLSNYVCEDWGKPLEFDPTLERMGLIILDGLPIHERMRKQAREFNAQRKGYMVGYEVFGNCNYPKWFDMSWISTLERWEREYGIQV